jgi:hypothetical protein
VQNTDIIYKYKNALKHSSFSSKQGGTISLNYLLMGEWDIISLAVGTETEQCSSPAETLHLKHRTLKLKG